MVGRQRLSFDVIVDEAAVVVDQYGSDGLSLNRVAANLGVKSSALYNHIDGIDGLRRALAIHATENLGAALRDAIVARSGHDAVRELAVAYRDFASAHAGQYASAMLPSGERGDALAHAQSQIVELFVLVARNAGLTRQNAVHTARVLRSAIHGYVSLESIDALTRPLDRTKSFDRMVAMLVTQIPI